MASNLKIVATLAFASVLLLVSLPASDAKKIVVGGPQLWKFGYNYTAWALKAGPFHVGDVLVFKYKPTIIRGFTVNHSVLLLHSHKAFEKCSFSKAIYLAGPAGGNPGFEFKLTNRKHYYFACGIAKGLHCNAGLMKFTLKPI